tara:strand:+ start:55 stop:795 length:741 start_codon:yes stop_codon:yes gene_type:complete
MNYTRGLTMKKYLLTLLLVLPSVAFSGDLDDFYITAKGGLSESMNTGTTQYTAANGILRHLSDEDLGTGAAFGLSAGKYLTDNFRLEMEATRITGFNYDTFRIDEPIKRSKADIVTYTLFINGFYDFRPLTISNTPITPYLGGGVGVSRNSMRSIVRIGGSGRAARVIDGDSNNEFAYKLSAGILVNLTQRLSLDVSYQYVNLGAFRSQTRNFRTLDGTLADNLLKGYSDGEIITQELMVGLQYKF